MDKKSKILMTFFVFLITISVSVTYWRIMIKKDYVVEAQTDCDPYIERCFVWECDPESEIEGESCTGNPESDVWYYKIVRRNAARIPLCDPETNETCDPWTCGDNESECESILCDESSKIEQGAECNDPVQYVLDNPVKEEVGDCEEDDKECLAAEEETMCDEENGECAAYVESEESEDNNEADAADLSVVDIQD